MHKLATFMNIAYGTEYHHTGTAHFFNDSECFDEFYALVLDADKDVIDLGFNIGLQAELIMRHTGGRIFGFEASKRIYEHARERFKDTPQVRLYNLAVSNATGTAEFIDTAFWGAGSLKYTAGMVSCAVGEQYEKTEVELVRLDDVLRDENNIGAIKLDIEGAELLALEGARELLARNRPFMVMEYCHNALAFEFRGAPITGETLFHFANELGYKVYNIYGICLSNPRVWETSILNDTADVFLIPEEQHARWVEHLLPVYQYRIYDKMLDRIEWSAPLHLALGALPSRIHDFVNNADTDAHPEYFASLRARLTAIGTSRQDVIGHPQLNERAKLLLLLLLADECDDAIRLARLYTLHEDELAEFRRLAGFSAAHPSGRAKRPYYVAAPEYVRSSAGTRAMYLLCHHLNSIGEDAYVYSGTTAPGLDTPLLTDEVKKRHFAAGLAPIAVYPEIVHGNPLAAPSVARYVLNHPGLIGGPKSFPEGDAVYFYNAEYANSLPTLPRKILWLPVVDETVFHPPESGTAEMRQGVLVYPGRFAEAAERHPELFRNATVITQDWPETREALADLLRCSELLYCFSNSAIIHEAVLCGCPVVVMDSPLTAEFLATYQRNPQYERPPGMALDASPAEIERARQSIAKFRDLHVAAEAAFQEQLRQFIADTQDLPVDRAIVSGSTAAANADRTRHSLTPSDESYHHWMKTRALEEEDGVLMADTMAFTWTVKPRIQLVVRCRAEQSPSLADTLDSLNFQFYSNYRIDIFASFDAPEALRSAMPALGWHVVDDIDRAADAISAIVAENACDWLVELPPGALLDPQYLFRIVHQINLDRGDAAPCAYFTDDDRLDSKQIRRQPRFKPEFDPEWLLASDLLGPLVVSADAWSACGGASANATRPWYDLALRLVDTLGNGALRHIAEPVLSLPESLSGDGHAAICAAAVRRHLTRRQLNGKVSVSSADTWSVRYRNTSRPAVTIAIPSADKPEYLEQCIEAILGATTYGDYEILIVATDCGDADVPAVIERLLQHREATVRHVTAAAPLNTAHFANTAAAAAAGDYLLLLADDVRVTRADWLDVLVSHALRPQVGVVGTLLVSALDGTIAHAGYVPGLGGDVDSPHQGKARPGDGGYLNCLAVSRSVAAVSASCMLVSVADYRAAGGMDEERFAVGHADVDFCLRLRRATGKHCIVLAELPLARLGGSVLDGDAIGAIERAEAEATRLQAKERLLERWFDEFAGAAFWSKHLSRNGVDPVIETRIVPDWHVLPMTSRRIMAFPIRSAQGQIRVTQPLQALKRAGQAQICLFTPSTELSDIPLAEDLARHRPDTIVTHQFIGPDCLAAMRQWRKHMRDTFLVYSVDDLMTQMPIHSSLRLGVPADTRSYLSRALQCSDRLIVSTDHLAEAYGHLAQETCVVPNRLERDLWVPLQSGRRSTPRPRVGWAGGTAHAGDLQVIAELVAATAQEVDWIFMGMCPDNIRPHVREFHPFGDYRNYPQRLAALNLDLAVAPLEQIPFNRGKSNLRLLEYGILGIPVICTDIDPYRDSPACKVPNRPQAWLEALRARIHDLDATAREGDSMRQWVLAHYILEDHLEEWMRAYSPS